MVVFGVIALVSFQAFASPGNHLNWGHQLSATEEACPAGGQILNVVRKIVNSLDSGTGSNDYGLPWWANTEYVQHIQVVELEPGAFCATIKTQGSFETVGGDGPGCAGNSNCGSSEGRLEAGVVGTFQGGMIQTFTGAFAPGSMRTKGSIGTFDGECDASTGQCSVSSLLNLWRTEYFTGVGSLSYPWWGWVYHAGNNGSWVNKTDGNEGNITGE